MIEKNMLVIDVDPVLMNTLVDIFIKEGFTRAIGATPDQDLSEIIRRKKPNVILLNINIAGEDSFEILSKIKAVDPIVDIIMFAEQGDVKLAERALQMGACSYVVKSDSISETAKKAIDAAHKSMISVHAKPDMNILVVDDSKMDTAIVEKYLTSENYNCFVINDAREVLRAVRSVKPQLIFLDIVMPGIDGIELLKQIKAVEEGIKIVMISGISDTQICSEAIRSGASGYITKPFSLQQLGVAITIALMQN